MRRRFVCDYCVKFTAAVEDVCLEAEPLIGLRCDGTDKGAVVVKDLLEVGSDSRPRWCHSASGGLKSNQLVAAGRQPNANISTFPPCCWRIFSLLTTFMFIA